MWIVFARKYSPSIVSGWIVKRQLCDTIVRDTVSARIGRALAEYRARIAEPLAGVGGGIGRGSPGHRRTSAGFGPDRRAISGHPRGFGRFAGVSANIGAGSNRLAGDLGRSERVRAASANMQTYDILNMLPLTRISARNRRGIGLRWAGVRGNFAGDWGMLRGARRGLFSAKVTGGYTIKFILCIRIVMAEALLGVFLVMGGYVWRLLYLSLRTIRSFVRTKCVVGCSS